MIGHRRRDAETVGVLALLCRPRVFEITVTPPSVPAHILRIFVRIRNGILPLRRELMRLLGVLCVMRSPAPCASDCSQPS